MDGHPQGMSCPASPQWCWAWSQRSLFSHSCSEFAASVLVPGFLLLIPLMWTVWTVTDWKWLLQPSALSGSIRLLHSAPWGQHHDVDVVTWLFWWPGAGDGSGFGEARASVLCRPRSTEHSPEPLNTSSPLTQDLFPWPKYSPA